MNRYFRMLEQIMGIVRCDYCGERCGYMFGLYLLWKTDVILLHGECQRKLEIEYLARNEN